MPSVKRFVCLLCLFLAVSGYAQGQEQSGLLKTDKGILVVWNEPGNYYTIEIQGRKIEPGPKPLWFKVDERFVQIVATPTRSFLKGTPDNHRTILTAHRDWEANHIHKLLGAKPKVDSTWVMLPNGTEALAWDYSMPKINGNQGARKQFYLAVVKRDGVFLINAAMQNKADDKSIRQFLIETMNTLKSSDKPLPLKDAQEQIIKGP